jgi:catalase
MNKTGLIVAAVLMVSIAAYGQKTTLGQEHVPPDEQQSIQKIANIITEQVQAAYANGQHPALRDAHAKAQGCVRATFSVLPNLPKTLRQGVFATVKSYPAWIRFSNGSGKRRNDDIGDGRGMAIKLMGVEGRKILPNEANAKTQDFLMINFPVFFVRNVADYLELNELERQNKADEFFKTHPHEEKIVQAITGKVVNSVFEQQYFSMTPYMLGPHYIKFSAIPAVCGSGAPLKQANAAPPKEGPNYLHTNMVQWLGEKDACFNFAVQLQTDPATMPIEDPTIEWSESESPFVDVATIRIPKQNFDSPAQESFCENLSYTPWHSLPADRPVGGINRVRKVVYQRVSDLRHSLNKTSSVEPAANGKF